MPMPSPETPSFQLTCLDSGETPRIRPTSPESYNGRQTGVSARYVRVVPSHGLYGKNMNGSEASLETCLLQWIRSFEGVGKGERLVDLNDGGVLWSVLSQIDDEYFAGDLPEPDVSATSDWTRKWQNLKHIDRQIAMYYRDVCEGQEHVDPDFTPDLKAVAAEGSVRDLEKLIMLVIRAAMASPTSNQKMAQRLMSLGRENAMVIANELRDMEQDDYEESEPVSRDESAYQSEQELPEEDRVNGKKGSAGGLYQDSMLEREEELLRAQATIDKLQASQKAAQTQLQELRYEKERLQEAFDAYRSEIAIKGRTFGSDDAFKKLQRQADNDRAYIEDLEGQLQSSRGTMDNYERQLQRHKEDGDGSQTLRDELQLLRAENEDLNQKIKANENLKKKIQALQDQEKVNVTLREDLKQANEKLEELDKLRQVQAGLEKEIIEKRGLIRNQEYQITELTTTRKHAEYDARVLGQKLTEARERHDRDHEAMEELRVRLRDTNLDDTNHEVPTPMEIPQLATPGPESKPQATIDESKHWSEKLALLEQQLEAADARLKQSSARNAVLEEKQQSIDTDADVRRKAEQKILELQSTVASLQKEKEVHPPRKSSLPALTQDMAMLQRENQLMASAFHDLSARLQNNGVSLGRRRQEPKSWIGKQRALIGPSAGMAK